MGHPVSWKVDDIPEDDTLTIFDLYTFVHTHAPANIPTHVSMSTHILKINKMVRENYLALLASANYRRMLCFQL